MRYPDRITLCVSSPGRLRHELPVLRHRPGGPDPQHVDRRDRRAGRRRGRALAARRDPGGPGRVSNIVFMGMGEPLANYQAVLGAVRRMTDPAPDGLGISARGMTVSTVGLVRRSGSSPPRPAGDPCAVAARAR